MKGLLFLCLLACKCQIALCDHHFIHHGSRGYLIITLDEKNSQLIVGGKGHIWRLGLNTLNELEDFQWESSNEERETCKVTPGVNDDLCHNFIRILMITNYGFNLITCGTNSYVPKCVNRNPTDLSDGRETFDGAGICPFSPDFNVTAVKTSRSGLFVGTAFGILSQNKAIFRQQYNSTSLPALTTIRRDRTWLDDPNFVSSYEIGNYVYFFLREIAVEFTNCEKRIFSRVARVCKSDMGGRHHSDNWMSFRKARLNCSLSGEYPFYFGHLQSTYYAKDEGLIYGVFTTPPNAITASSAVCVYTVSNVESVFDGPFKYQESPTSAWLRKDTNTYRCTGNRSRGNHRNEENNVNYHLSDDALQPNTLNPITWASNERWSHIVVDNVRTKHGNKTVLFVANGQGRINKMLYLPRRNKTCLLQVISIRAWDMVVQNMLIARKWGAIYISADSIVVKKMVNRCDTFTTRTQCFSANSPYCGWDPTRRICARAPDGNPNIQSYIQRPITDCNNEVPHDGLPRTPSHPHPRPATRQKRGAEAQKPNKTPVNGNWSKWSGWEKCSTVGKNNTASHCLCRSRSCDNPKPINNGADCKDEEMQMTNCINDKMVVELLHQPL